MRSALACVAIWFLVTLSSTLAQPHPDDRDRFSRTTRLTSFTVQVQDKLVYFPVQIKGHDLWFVLDSGSSRTLMDQALAATLNLKTQGSGSVQGAGAGRVPIQFVQDVELQLPGLRSSYDEISTIDLKDESRQLGRQLDGILGYPFLSRFVVTIDYENEKATVQAPETFSPPENAPALAVTFKGKWPTITADLLVASDATMQDHFLVDSGSSDDIDHPVVTKMESKQATVTGVGLGTPGSGYSGKLWGFRIAGFTLHDQPITCCGATDDTSRLIGGGILHRFTVIFDYPHSRIYLQPNRYFRAQ